MQESRTAFAAGEQVELRERCWTIVDVERFDHVTLLTLRGDDGQDLGRAYRFLLPFDRARVISRRARLVHSTRPEVLRLAAGAIAGTPPWDQCWTAATARIDLRTWQMEPARAAILGATRILLADEVGLGKTIQAGLIVAELMARGLAQRILILAPASLRSQWAAELSDKFGLVATIVDQTTLAEMSMRLPPGTNPWNVTSLMVSSLDLVKRAEVRSALDEVSFDALIVDEAHHLTPGTDRAAVVADLAERTPWLVLATATPHTGDEAAYRALQLLGAGPGDAPFLMFRRRATDVHASVARRNLWLGVRPTRAERLLLEATANYYRALQRAAGGEPTALLVAGVIARRATSLAAAALRTLERRLALMKGARPETQESLPWDEGDQGDSPLGDHLLAVHGLPEVSREIEWLEQLVALARSAADGSSKAALIGRLIRRSNEPMIVFSEYRDVAIAIARRLSEITSVVVIHGGVAAAIRRDRIRAFTDGTVRVLVTTDAAGEGLNLQARCRLVLNLELPWNPVRIDQRIGRVDRIGQSQRVHAIYLYHRDSFEEVVRSNLDRRRRSAATAVWMGIREGGAPFASVERRLRELGRPASTSRTLYNSEASSGPGRNHIVLLFAANHLDAAGHLVQRNCVALRLELTGGDQPLTRQSILSINSNPLIRKSVDHALRVQLARTTRVTTNSAEGIERRIESILTLLDGRSDPVFQGSLFDRKAEHQARMRSELAMRVRVHLTRRLECSRALRRVRSTEPRLVAAWIGR